jgi:predicted MFS family arabinose efflux permease
MRLLGIGTPGPSMEPTLNPPHRSAIALTALAYIPSVLSMMPVGVLVPFIDALSRNLGATPPQLGLAIALFSVPSAILATLGGGLIDRYGVRRSLLSAAAALILGSVLASQVHSLLALDCAMVVSGLGFAGICVGAPCLVMATLRNGVRTRSMALCSTFAPTGYAGGLLLAVPFTDSGDWRTAFLAHAAMMTVAFGALLLFVPNVASVTRESRGSMRQTFADMLNVIREPRALRLAVAIALPNAVSYGTSLAVPSYLARVHHLTIAHSSATVAFAKLAAMIIGGLSMGYLLSRQVRISLLFAFMVATGLLAQTILFLPASGMTLATVALMLWLFSFGGMAGGGMTLLPTVVRDPARSGAASGLVNQAISIVSFATPSTWLALHSGMQYVLLATACLLISLIALPASGAASSNQTTPAVV